MAFKTLVVAIAFSMVPMARAAADTANGVDVVSFKSKSAVSGTKVASSSASESTSATEKEQITSDSNWAPEDPTSGNSSSGSFVAVVSLLMFGLIPLLVVAFILVGSQARHALLSAGIISADSEITKLSIKASGATGPIADQLQKIPLVQQAIAAVESAFPGDLKVDRTLINEDDGEDEEDAMVMSSRPMGNVADMIAAAYDSGYETSSAPQQVDDLMDFGFAPQPDFQIHIDHHQNDLIGDDFFDDEDDF